MALVNCHECNNQVSDSARACPNCGAPVRATQQHIIKWNLAVKVINHLGDEVMKVFKV